jgi:ribosomal-protein-serine acetyltransferase
MTIPPFIPNRIETPRMILRPPRAGDGRAINDAIRETFDALKQWMPWAKDMPTVADSEQFARENAAKYRRHEDFPILLFDKATDELIGASGVHPKDWYVPKFEIGYWVRACCEGQGYVTEAVVALTAFGFGELGAARMEIRCDSRNTRSAAVAVRAGYTLEATLHHDMRANDGILRDTLVFARFV